MKKLTPEETSIIHYFFEEVESSGFLPEFSSEELINLHQRAEEGDLISTKMFVALMYKVLPQLDQDILKKVLEERNKFR